MKLSVNIPSAITQKKLDNVLKKLLYSSKRISRQNAENVNWLLLAKYKILQERDKLKKELVILQAESRGNTEGLGLAGLENKTFSSRFPTDFQNKMPPWTKIKSRGVVLSPFFKISKRIKAVFKQTFCSTKGLLGSLRA